MMTSPTLIKRLEHTERSLLEINERYHAEVVHRAAEYIKDLEADLHHLKIELNKSKG